MIYFDILPVTNQAKFKDLYHTILLLKRTLAIRCSLLLPTPIWTLGYVEVYRERK